jgi:NADH-quinone oxidoreductase subunit G
MPTITIDGKQIEVPEGTKIIEAARLAGIIIPRYCYHPGLTIAGSCRLCQVEIEERGRRRLDISCNIPVSEGMIVYTDTDLVRDVRKGVLEFLLVNHPIDCPICDDAGECDLQNYYMQNFGRYDSRFFEPKVHKHKVYDLGPTVVLDAERCVLCSRCVRFCAEISKTFELGIFGHGSKSELINYPDKPLDNPYSLCVVDLCPVGALTSKDFRFKRRVWYLKTTPSVCPSCSRGCSIEVHYDMEHVWKDTTARVHRLKPHYNPNVNDWWMCDRGRTNFRWVDANDRLISPRIKDSGGWSNSDWDASIGELSFRLSKIIKENGSDAVGIIASSKSSTEDLFVWRRLMDDLKVTNRAAVFPDEPKGEEDDILRKADLNPNRYAVDLLGFEENGSPGSAPELLSKAIRGKIKALIVCHHDLSPYLESLGGVEALDKLDLLVYVGCSANPTQDAADISLPAAAWVERFGTFINYRGWIQRFFLAVPPIGESMSEWKISERLAAKMGHAYKYTDISQVFHDVTKQVKEMEDLSWDGIGPHGDRVMGAGKSDRQERPKSYELASTGCYVEKVWERKYF